MNKLISQVFNESRVQTLEVVSLEQEMELTLAIESYRHQIEHDFSDINRTFDLIEAMEGMAIVAQEIETPTPHQAALIQIGGDVVMAGTDMDGSEITPALEDIKETGQAIAGKVRAAIETILRALRELLSKIGGVVRKYIQSIRFAVGGHVQRLKVIKERLATTEFSLNSGEEFMFSMPVVGDESLRSLSEILKEALKFNFQIDNFIKYSTDFNISYGSGLTDLYQKLGGDGIDVVEQFSILGKIAESTSHIRNRLSTHTPPQPNVDYFDIKKFTSEPLIGGVSIVQTTVLLRSHEAAMSSAMLSQAISEITSNIGIKVELAHLGFGRDDYSVKPLTKAEIEQAIKICEELIEHFTGKSEHLSLAICSARRLEFAETSVEHITKYVEKFKKDNVASKQYAEASLRVSNSIIQNATLPYSYMTTAVNRCITVLTSAIIKSLNAYQLQVKQDDMNKQHAASMQQPSTESISDELVYSEEGFFGDIIDGVKKALGLRKPTKLNLQKIKSGYQDLKDLKTKIQKNYIQTKHEVKTGEISAGNISPYLFVYKGSQDPIQLPNEWKSALQSGHGAMTDLADMMAKAGMEGYAIFKKYSNLEKSVDNFKKMEVEFEQFLRKWKAPAKPNLSGVLKNFQFDDMTLLGKNPNIVSWDERKTWTMSKLKPSIASAVEHLKLPMLTSEQIPSVGTAMIEAIDFLMNHQLQEIIKDDSETLFNVGYGHQIVIYDFDWIEEQYGEKTLTEKNTINTQLIESASDQFQFLYYDLLIEYFTAVISMILATDRWISASIKD